jgi:2-dehydro-3-deoxyphosphooctonate aldolase (KDO 8-P synthase)
LTREIKIGDIVFGAGHSPLIIAGPCVIESEDVVFQTARQLKQICMQAGLSFVFKSSYDKANRSSVDSYRGPGIEKGLRILSDVRTKFEIPVISDVHSIEEVKPASEALDALQIPAFLCRQTDLILATSKTGKPVNIKKGQFLAPWDVGNIIDKFSSAGNLNFQGPSYHALLRFSGHI